MTKAGNTLIAGLKTIRTIGVCAISVMLMLASCRKDHLYSMEPRVTLTPAVSINTETVITTRAQEVTVYENGTPSSTHYHDSVANNTIILVYAVPTDPNPVKEDSVYGTFRFRSNKWRSSVTPTDGKNYNIYAITPNNFPGASNQTFNWGGSPFNANNVKFTFSGLDVITSSDPMVNIAAAGKHTMYDIYDGSIEKQVKTEGNPPELEPLVPPTLTKGSYSIGKVVKPAEGDPNDFYRVWMAMNHFYAKATLSFRIDAAYDAIRDIRIKDVKMVVDKDERTLTGVHTYSYTDGLQLAGNADFGSAPGNQDLVVDLLRGESSTALLDDEADYITLTTNYKEFGWFCFLPITYTGNSSSPLRAKYPAAKLKVTYDVLCPDNINGGMRVIRENETVENNFPLNLFKRDDDPEVVPEPGHHFKVKVTVKPTYLYQLSDDDAKLELSIE